MSSPTISLAACALRAGCLVAIPTETVYGLAADATNSDAVRGIFAAKGRPGTNPVIVHVADAVVARRYAAVWPEVASLLAERFWPGPLTIVLPKVPAIVPEVTAGLGTVGLRVPAHPLTLELLREFDGPLAAPSANRSTRVSPTTAKHVRDELGDAVDLILDGGPCAVGIESTVLDLSAGRPRILRPGGVSRAEIERIIGPVDGGPLIADPAQAATSPGQHLVHYSPATPAFRFTGAQTGQLRQHADRAAGPVGILAFAAVDVPAERVVRMPTDADAYARILYSTLRDLDAAGLRAIYIELPPDEPQWLAIHDRLRRATSALPGRRA
ncbi:MAG: L-threonylcarbamoyladenylate synthase [Tepidisphaerales bacterium]